MAKRHWLLKSEPSVFSIDDLEKAEKQTTSWEGVRNYQARNILRDEMKPGDLALFYHSAAEPPCAVGVAEVVKGGYPDPFDWNKRSKYFDPKSDPSNPTWFMVDVKFKFAFKTPVTLETIKRTPGLENMMVARKGSRLSVQPVAKNEWDIILKLGGKR